MNLRSTPQTAQQIMIDIQPIDIFFNHAAAKTALRLRSWGTAHGGTPGSRQKLHYPCSDVQTREDSSDECVIFDTKSEFYVTGSGLFSADLGIMLDSRPTAAFFRRIYMQ